ncbi:MAG: hypothetical protein Q9187_003968 [Circinaria calcarea]
MPGNQLIQGTRRGGVVDMNGGVTQKQSADGKPVSHGFAKELLAGFAGAEVDKLAETAGMDEVDNMRVKDGAKETVVKLYDEHYINNKGADQYDSSLYDPPSQLRYGENHYWRWSVAARQPSG